MLHDGTIKIYEYSFISAAIYDEKVKSYGLMNVQDEIQAKPNTFEQRFLYHKSVEAVLPKKGRHREKVYAAFRKGTIEAKADDFGKSIDNAREDFINPQRMSLITQVFVDEIYRIRKLGRPPQIHATILPRGGTRHDINLDIDLRKIIELAGPKLNFHPSTPLTAAALSNRLIWSAAKLNSDLYLPSPMSALIGDKLYESAEVVNKAGDVIEDLKAKVEFPDIRSLVNDGKLAFSDVLSIRNKAQKFRGWLQTESDRDRDAIIAYHNEVAREVGLLGASRKALSIFGAIGGSAIGTVIGASVDGALGGALGGAAGSSIGYLSDVASKFRANWKPVIFGNWLRDHIEQVIRDKQ